MGKGMRLVIGVGATLVWAGAGVAQQADMLRSIESAEEKLVALANAMPAAAWAWRPGEGVRSTGEVMQHVAADNWFLPTGAGIAAPEASGIKPNDYPSVRSYEQRTMTREQIMDEVSRSFAHLRRAVEQTGGEPDRAVELFGNPTTVGGLWLLTTTHLHEHLGQLIAYARTNGVVPPWSR
jgi:uncharacterized damage-inducible protein DinB